MSFSQSSDFFYVKCILIPTFLFIYLFWQNFLASEVVEIVQRNFLVQSLYFTEPRFRSLHLTSIVAKRCVVLAKAHYGAITVSFLNREHQFPCFEFDQHRWGVGTAPSCDVLTEWLACAKISEHLGSDEIISPLFFSLFWAIYSGAEFAATSRSFHSMLRNSLGVVTRNFTNYDTHTAILKTRHF